ncbi:SCP2 domain-containing protein [Leeia sp.]|uniref:ubiquinone biosynthesis accessory factor UbiJ n=1 Tax=Leeia sp. TaxID=2884678 RepID=UPI0035B11DAD
MMAHLAISAFNHLLQQQDWLCEQLRPFAGRKVALGESPLQVVALIQPDGYLHALPGDAEPDASIRIPLSSLPLMLGDAAQRRGAVQISGDPALAAALGEVLQALQWDVSADLSRLLGDTAATPIARQWQQYWDTHREQWQVLGQQLAEYARDEAGLLADPEAVSRFVNDIDTLRDDVARLEARLSLLEAKRSATGDSA